MSEFMENPDKEKGPVWPPQAVMWTRDQAFYVIERLEPIMAVLGAHVALGGSVVYRGQSCKDLDIIIYPHNKQEQEVWDTYPLKEALNKFFSGSNMNDCKGFSQVRDGKQVSWLKTPKGKRVDFFFLS